MKPLELFLQVQHGLEDLAGKELLSLGYKNFKRYSGGFELFGHWNAVQGLNFDSLLLSRVLIRLNKFTCKTFWDFEKVILKTDFEPYLSLTKNICIRVNSKSSALYHEAALQGRFHNFLEQKYNRRFNLLGEADSVNTQMILLTSLHDQFVISIDTSGKHLHKRGYNDFRADAPLRETVASAMLQAVNIAEYDTIYDPFTGSGTIPFEAHRLLNRMSSDKFREFRFQKWGIQVKTNNEQITACKEQRIIGSDVDEKTLEIANRNLQASGFSERISFYKKNFFDLGAGDFSGKGKTFICSNPPWGKRVHGKSISKIMAKANELKEYADIALLIPDIYLPKASKYRKLFTINSGEITVSAILLL